MCDVDAINPETLRGREGENFTLGEVEVKLVSVTTTEYPGLCSTIAIFAAAEPHGLQQELFLASHPELAETTLFAAASSPTDLCVTFTSLT